MSGTGTTTSVVTATGDQYIDGVLTDRKWADSVIYYAFSKTSAAYNYTTLTDLPANFRVFSAAQETAAEFALDGTQNAAAVGFSIAGFTLADIQSRGEVDSTTGTNIRFGGTTSSQLGTSRVADFPGNYLTNEVDDNGDVWIGSSTDNTIYDYRTPAAGNYAWYTHLHEIGHAMGLKHSQENSSFGAVPLDEDSMEYTVMSYRSYYNADDANLQNEPSSYAQTYMMLDIAALQTLYGANYTINSGDTVYKWFPDSGRTDINDFIAIQPVANRIFATIWDGGGNDTYDLSAYTSAVSIDLEPGKSSVFSSAQLADLGDDGVHIAHGNIYNALEYQGNQASEIENAIGGSGNDTITGNDVDNVLTGGGGADVLTGGVGADALVGGAGRDTASYSTAAAGVTAKLAAPAGNTGDASGDSYDSIENLTGSGFADILTGDGKANSLDGGAGRDTLSGGNGSDKLTGGAGKDKLTGGGGADHFLFDAHQTGAKNSSADIIFDFSHAQRDKIDLHAIDANSKAGGDQAFTFIGTDRFDHHAGELRYVDTSTDTFIYGDVNGDGKQDFVIRLHEDVTVGSGFFIL